MDAWFAALPVAGAVVAALAALRAHATGRALAVPSLLRLRSTFALLAVAALAQAALGLLYEDSLDGGGPARSGLDAFDVLFWLHHAAVVAALVCALPAQLRLAAAVPILAASAPVLRTVEAAGFLALTAWSARNHMRRATVGSLAVALGWLGLTAATATSAWAATPVSLRPWWVEALALAGLVLLWHGLPRRPRLG